MLVKHARYAVTNVFCGLIWKGRALVGLDLDSDAVGIIVGRYYAGWMWQ